MKANNTCHTRELLKAKGSGVAATEDHRYIIYMSEFTREVYSMVSGGPGVGKLTADSMLAIDPFTSNRSLGVSSI